VQPVYMNLPTGACVPCVPCVSCVPCNIPVYSDPTTPPLLLAVISLTWFSVSERDFAMTILSLANTAGSAMGSIVPTLIVTESDTDAQSLGPAIASLLLVQLVCAAVAMVAVYIWFTSAPALPPSVAAGLLQKSNVRSAGTSVVAGGGASEGSEEEEEQTKKSKKRVFDDDSMWQNVKKLLGNTQYVLLLCGFACAIGSLNSLASLLGQLPTNNTPSQVGIIGFCIILSGFFGAVSCGAILSTYKAYATTLKAAFIGALTSLVCFFLACHNDNFALMCLTGGMTGFFVLATIPAGLQCAVECTHPVSEDAAVGLMQLTANLVTIPYTFLGQAMLANNGTAGDDNFNADVNDGVQYGWYAVFATSVLAFGALCVMAFRSGDYRRLKLDIVSESLNDGDSDGQRDLTRSHSRSRGSRNNSINNSRTDRRSTDNDDVRIV